MGKDHLLEIGRGLELDVTRRMGVEELRGALAKSKRAKLDAIVGRCCVTPKKKPAASLVRSSAAEYLTFVAASGMGGVEAIYADENV